MADKKYEIDMCSGPILGKLMKLTIPIMLSSILQLLFNAADMIVAGNFGSENALAAVGSTGSLIALIVNLFIGLTTGANVLASRYMGAKDEKKISKIVHTSMVLALICGAFLTLFGLVFADKMLILMQAPSDVRPLSALYLRIYFIGMIPMLMYNFGNSILRSKGDTRRPLYYLTAAGAINVVLNFVFVVFFKWDVIGVAASSVISQCFSAVLTMRCLIKESGGFKFSLSKLHADMQSVKDILRIGVPSGIQGVVFSISNVVIQAAINSFGSYAMAGSAAATSITDFVWVAMVAFSSGALTFVGQNIGGGKYSRINRVTVIACACSGVVGLVLGNLVCIFGKQLIGIYDPRPEVLGSGMIRLQMMGIIYFICGIMDCLSGAIRGMGYSLAPTLVSIIGVCGIRLVWIFTVFAIPEYHTEFVLYLSYSISWIVTLLAHAVSYVILRRRFPEKDAEPMC